MGHYEPPPGVAAPPPATPKSSSTNVSTALIVGIAAVVAIAVAMVMFRSPAWQAFSVPGTEFRLDLPGVPKATTQKIPTALGELEQKMWSVEGRRTAYMIATVDYPAETVANADPWTMLEGARNGALGNVSGTLLSESRLSYRGHPGLDITANADKGQKMSMRGRIFLIGPRLVILLAVGPRDKLVEKDVLRFFGNAGNAS